MQVGGAAVCSHQDHFELHPFPTFRELITVREESLISPGFRFTDSCRQGVSALMNILFHASLVSLIPCGRKHQASAKRSSIPTSHPVKLEWSLSSGYRKKRPMLAFLLNGKGREWGRSDQREVADG